MRLPPSAGVPDARISTKALASGLLPSERKISSGAMSIPRGAHSAATIASRTNAWPVAGP